MSGPHAQKGVLRPGPQDPEEGRIEGAKNVRTAPEAPRGPTPLEARLEIEEMELRALEALTDFFASIEFKTFTDVYQAAKAAKETLSKLWELKFDLLQEKRREAKKDEGWMIVKALKPVNDSDKAIQWLAKKADGAKVEWEWIRHNGLIIGLKYRSTATIKDLENAACWAFQAAANRPSGGSQPPQEKQQ